MVLLRWTSAIPFLLVWVNLCAIWCVPVYAFDDSTGVLRDTVAVRTVEVRQLDLQQSSVILRMEDISSNAIYAGRKTEVVAIDQRWMNTASNQAREAFASVAGINIWESDGSGVQLGIGGRGLSPNRTSNFTTRQNGYDIAADPLGYPESYYTPPLDLVERIDIVRGGGALRYGTQFGGTINFVLRAPERSVPLQARVAAAGGSFGQAMLVADLSGTIGATSYRAYYQGKRGDGWRPHSAFDAHTAYAGITIAATDRLQIRAEYTSMRSLAQQPGGLTDEQFQLDPSMSLRGRNWFNVESNIASVSVDYLLGETTTLRSLWFGNASSRISLGNLDPITTADTGGERTMIDGRFAYVGTETTVSFDTQIIGLPASFVTGFRAATGTTTQQQGNGSDGSGPDFRFLRPSALEGSSFTFPVIDAALFAEGVFTLGRGWRFIPGVRAEHISTGARGWYRNVVRDSAGSVLSNSEVQEDLRRPRTIVLIGGSLTWNPVGDIECYVNAAQNYRSIQFFDLRITNPNLVVDPNLRDEHGYTIDVGVRGRVASFLTLDASWFYLRYNDRIGEVVRQDRAPLYQPYRFRSNVADMYTTGVETVIDVDVVRAAEIQVQGLALNMFANLCVLEGRYLSSENVSVQGKQVEFAPSYTVRTGLRTAWKGASLGLLVSAVGAQYSDANNTTVSSTAVTGRIPSYIVADLTAGYTTGGLIVTASFNNLFNAQYFTRRASSYPGPGIIPAEPRTIQLMVSWTADVIRN